MKFDQHVCGIKEKNIHQNYEFSLFERENDGSIIEVKHNGVWLLCDNGYLKWSILIFYLKFSLAEKKYYFQNGLKACARTLSSLMVF